MAESMKDFEQELEASFKKIEEVDIIAGTVVSVDETVVVLDLKYYAEGFIPAEEFSATVSTAAFVTPISESACVSRPTIMETAWREAAKSPLSSAS